MTGARARRAATAAVLRGRLAHGAGCAGAPGVRGPIGDPVLRALAERGWTVVSPPRVFSPATLYEEIDGEAELYLPYDFRSLAVAVLARPGNRAAEVRIALFRHGSAPDAWGVYSLRRFPGQQFTAVGPSEAIVSDASVEFARGETFVQVAQGSPAASRGTLLDAAQAISDALQGPGGPPPEAAVLSTPSAVRRTTVYQKRAILGYESLAPGFEARFASGDLSGTLLFVEPRPAGAPPLADSLARGLPEFEAVAGGVFRARLRTATLWLVSEQGLYAGAAADRLTREQAEPLLAELRTSLDAYAKTRGAPR